jgi:TonB-linked SusC/RagA family outer membrane protein
MKKKLHAFKNEAGRRIILALSFVIFSGLAVLAQEPAITGKVVASENDSALNRATVKVKGANVSTITQADGSFTIKAGRNAVLIVSNVGFTTQEVAVNGRSEIIVRLTGDAQALQGIVVIGYGTAKRRDLTGSVASVTADQIAKVPITSLEQSLQGRASGVQVVSNDGAPGANVSVLIRGVGSLATNGNGPLYVVDGYPLTTGINNINPNDIASIDVLKDASATAIYGIRAANGVVIVTTKKGKRGALDVSLDAYTAFQSKPKKYKLLNAQDWATLSNAVEAADSTHTYVGLPIWHTPSALHTVDWQDALFRHGLSQNYSLAIRGGSDKMQTAASFGYYDQKGILIGSYFKRFTLGLNLDYQPTKWLKSSTSAKYAYQNANGNPLDKGKLSQLAINPPTLDSGSRLTNQIKDGNGNYGFYNPQNSNVFKFSNPVYTIETNRYSNVTNYFLGNSSLEVSPIDGLKIKTNAGINMSYFTGTFFQPEDNRAAQQFPGSIISAANYSFHQNNTFEWLWENTIAYDKTFGKHTINFVGGVSAQKNTNTLVGVSGIPPNSVIQDLGQLSNVKFDQYGNGQIITTLESQFARLTYAFDDKYIITGTVRRDGSSKFDVGHKYGTFPSAAIAWKVKDESFLRDVDWLTELKLRGSWGEVGNQTAIGPFQYAALYSYGGPPSLNGADPTTGLPVDNLGYPFNKLYQGGIAPSQPANPDLKWETDRQTDIGVDMAFLHGALTFTADWFNRDSRDFLLTLQAPAQTGYNFITRNIGSMNNKGFELALNYRGNQGRDFQYGIGLTVSHYKNTLTSIKSGTTYVTNFGGTTLTGQSWDEFTHSNVGGPVGEFYGYKSLGIFQTQAQINALNAKAPGGVYQRATNQPGDRYFADVNGDNKVDATDRTALGNPQPKFFGGLNFDGSYKAWDINLYFYGTYGNKILNYIESDLESFQKRGSEGVENVSQNYYKNRWTPTNPSNRYSRATANDDAIGSNVPSSVWIENGSYLKLRNLTIGYTLPDALLKQLYIKRLRIYASTQNLFTITKYTGLDPEIGIQGGNPTQNGVDNGTYPVSRSYTLGLNVTF